MNIGTESLRQRWLRPEGTYEITHRVSSSTDTGVEARRAGLPYSGHRVALAEWEAEGSGPRNPHREGILFLHSATKNL